MSCSAALAPLWRAALASGAALGGATSPAAALAASLPLARRLSTVAGAAAGAGLGGEEAPVIIAGGGPTGLTTALLLAKYGVRSVVLEKARTLTDHPQAHLINMRCMEVFRGMGGERGRACILACILCVSRLFDRDKAR